MELNSRRIRFIERGIEMKENMKLENLEKIRTSLGLSRKELEDISGVNQFTIQALETGINDAFNVKLSTLVALAKALEVKVIDLLPKELQKIIA